MKLRNIFLPLLFGAFLTSCNLPKPNLNNSTSKDDEEETERDEAFEDLLENYEDCTMTPEEIQEYVDAISTKVAENKVNMDQKQSYTIKAKSINNDGENLYGCVKFNKEDHQFNLYTKSTIQDIDVEYDRAVWIDKKATMVRGYEKLNFGQAADFLHQEYTTDEEAVTIFNNNLIPSEDTSIGEIGKIIDDFDITDLSTTLLVILKDPTLIPEELGDVEIKTRADNKGNLKAALVGKKGEDDDALVVKASFEFKNNLLSYARGTGFIDDYKERIELEFDYNKPVIDLEKY